VEHHQALVADPMLAAWLERTGARRIGYRELRDAQRRL
jgi:hypothetical protein